MTARTLLLVGGGVALGALGMYLLMPAAAPEHDRSGSKGAEKASRADGDRSRTERENPVHRVAARSGVDVNVVRAVVGSEVREAFAEQEEQRAVATQDEPSPNGEQQDDPQADEQNAPSEPSPGFDPAQAHIQDRLAMGSWNEEDRQKLSEALPDLTEEERKELILTVVRAANEKRLKVNLRGPLF